jgi:predicted hydrolase (HD superfamily)
VVAEQHAAWGAQMAEQAGAPELVVRLIAHHQDHSPANLSAQERVFLDALQTVDEVS